MNVTEPSFAVISRFRVANGMSNDIAEAFRHRPHLVEDAPGFIRMDVLSPAENDDEFWLLTLWTDEESYRNWHRGHTYRESHKQIPKGLKLDPAETEIRTFRYISS